MRISDWSSDVCSSDLLAERLLEPIVRADVDSLLLGCTHYPFLARTLADVLGRGVVLVSSADETAFRVRAMLGDVIEPAGRVGSGAGRQRWFSSGDVDLRSEEHTSELQSLMRTSYAVFCLKKKTMSPYQSM